MKNTQLEKLIDINDLFNCIKEVKSLNKLITITNNNISSTPIISLKGGSFTYTFNFIF